MLQFALSMVTLVLVVRAFRARWVRGLEWYQRLSAIFDRPAVITLVVLARSAPLVVRGRLHGDPSGRKVNVLPENGDPYRVPANRVAIVVAGDVLVEPPTAGRERRVIAASLLLILTPVLMVVTGANGGDAAVKEMLVEGAVGVFAIGELLDAFRD